MKSIASFHGSYRFLSNFWPCVVLFEGVQYPSVEHAYVAAKTIDTAERNRIKLMSAAEAKRYGRKLALRGDWDNVKLEIMERLLRSKFADDALRAQLLATGSASLCEGNTWGDTYWGLCRGTGQNHLGRLLMKIRADSAIEIMEQKR